MYRFIKSLLIIIFIAILQLYLYDQFIEPIITTWGASAEEISMPMAGDDKAFTITSTRAILINAPRAEVWKWLIQLGADRGGFYSYAFIEKAMGYKTRYQESIKPEFKTITVGDWVRGSIDEESSIIPYNFKVLYVKPEQTLVLANWGTFLLEPINNKQTRLVIRTQVPKNSNLGPTVANYTIIPLHFIMERGTLIGIKARAEAGEEVPLSQTKDIIWFSAIVLSGFLICILVFIGRGIIRSFILPCVLSSCWLCILLLLNPIPLYSMGLVLTVCAIILIAMRKGTSGTL